MAPAVVQRAAAGAPLRRPLLPQPPRPVRGRRPRLARRALQRPVDVRLQRGRVAANGPDARERRARGAPRRLRRHVPLLRVAARAPQQQLLSGPRLQPVPHARDLARLHIHGRARPARRLGKVVFTSVFYFHSQTHMASFFHC